MKHLVCVICGSAKCSGQIFEVKGYGDKYFTVCESHEYLMPNSDGSFRYKFVRGHGDFWYLPAVPISDEVYADRYSYKAK